MARKPTRIITVEQYDAIYAALTDDTMRLLVETKIETGLRWGELTELRPRDIDPKTRILTVSRAVVELKSKERPDNVRFVVKDYPKDKEWRQLSLTARLVKRIQAHAQQKLIGPGDLLFLCPAPEHAQYRRPAQLPDPAVKAAGLGFRVTPHGLRHAHASWLLAGGADLQVVKERHHPPW